MPDPAAIISAVAACGAAAFSGATLWSSGQKEERGWRREVMLDALVAFLESSFVRTTRQAMEATRRGEDISYVEAALAQREKQVDILARLRLLASNEVVLAAQALYRADVHVQNLLIERSVGIDETTWNELKRIENDARVDLINAARSALGLGDGLPSNTFGFYR